MAFQGDQCNIKFLISINGVGIDITSVSKVDFVIGTVKKSYPTTVTYTTPCFYFPITASESFGLIGSVPCQGRITLSNGDILGVDFGRLDVRKSLFGGINGTGILSGNGILRDETLSSTALRGNISGIQAGSSNIHSLTLENDLADGDEFPFYDISSSLSKKTVWSNIKAKLKAYFDNIYSATGAYFKPANGIPKTDLASGVQTSLDKADTALQEHQSLSAYSTTAQMNTAISTHHDSTKQDVISDLSTIRSGAALGATAVQPAAISDMATKTWTAERGYLTEHQSLSAYRTAMAQDAIDNTKANQSALTSEIADREEADADLQEQIDEKQDTLVSGTNIKTVNGQSILGSGDLGAGLVDDVTINGTSILDQKIAKIIYETGLSADSSNTATVTAIRAFVNSSINAVAAYYITADVSGNAFATKAALNVGPWYYAGTVRTPTRNDYAIVIADETHDGKTARYTYTSNQWAFQYTFNMSFTQGQIDAINSGISSAKVALYDTHIASTNNPHSVSKTQVGLGNVGNFKAVSTEASQGLNDTEKGNARANIGAGTSSFSGNYNDLTNKPTIPDISGKADKVTNATNGDFAGLDASGNLTDSGYDYADFLTTSDSVPSEPANINADTLDNHPASYFATATALDDKVSQATISTTTPVTLADNTIYNLSDVTTLDLSAAFPATAFDCIINLSTAASGTVTITFPTSIYIPAVPTFGNGETWTLWVRNNPLTSGGIVTAQKAVSS